MTAPGDVFIVRCRRLMDDIDALDRAYYLVTEVAVQSGQETVKAMEIRFYTCSLPATGWSTGRIVDVVAPPAMATVEEGTYRDWLDALDAMHNSLHRFSLSVMDPLVSKGWVVDDDEEAEE